jgi:hypothetical protein
MKHGLLYASALLGAGLLTAQTTRTQRPVGGFIPGDYFNTCPICEGRYMGSKHSMCCEVCGKCREDEYLTGNSLRQIQLNELDEVISSCHVPAVNTKWLEAHGKHDSRLDPILIVGGDHFHHIELAERFAQQGIPLLFQAPREHVGLKLGDVLNEHWPAPLPVEFPEIPYSVSYYSGDRPQERNRWAARGGMYEKALTKRRKANKAAKKARKKSRK